MPIHILASAVFEGVSLLPFAIPFFKVLSLLLSIWLLKKYFGGASNTSERLMHSKVVMITGGTSGIGATIAQHLASRGAQIILLTRHEPSDPFLVDYIDDMRASTSNELIYAEQMDLSSLQSIRVFATKWIDNAPPRRLDMVILCADSLVPKLGITAKTQEGLDPVWGINYLANFHFLGILSPAIRAQPPDRDVRIIVATCPSYIGGELKSLKDTRDPLPPGKKYETSKLACIVFAQAFQKHLDAYQRPDKQPNSARVIIVDAGFTRTPGMRRWLTMGSLWGLMLYLVMWPFWWVVLKSPLQGAQGFLKAAMETELGRGSGGKLLRECREVDYSRKEVMDEDSQKTLWAFSEKQIEALEKDGAVKRALAKKEKEESAKAELSEARKNGKDMTDEKLKSANAPKALRYRRGRQGG